MGPAGGRSPFVGAVCAAVLLSLSSCGGSGGGSPTQPSTPAPASTAGTLRGTITDVASGRPVEGATLSFNFGSSTATATSGAGGAWELTQPSSTLASIPVTVSAAGYVTRQTFVRWAVGTRSDIGVDLIGETAPFAMPFYRQLVRDLFDKPDDPPQPLRRWIRTPNFYINTFNPRTGRDLRRSEIDLLTEVIRSAVPQMTGGRFEAGTIETGSSDREPRAGTIRIKFVDEPDADYCGRAYVGADPGDIEINYDRCTTPCGAFAPRTVAHEVGHALGFYHVAEGRVLNTVWYNRDCGVTDFSETERHHASIAYARAVGNRDPDSDPNSTSLATDRALPAVRIACGR
jgi:hypothetical protein